MKANAHRPLQVLGNQERSCNNINVRKTAEHAGAVLTACE
jgi:hypothetical protein